MSENTMSTKLDSIPGEQVWKNLQMVKAVSNLLSEIINENKIEKDKPLKSGGIII
jgi:hypothetical protein